MKKLVEMLKSASKWLKECAMDEATECETAEKYPLFLGEII